MSDECYIALKEVVAYAKRVNEKQWGFYNKNSEYFKELELVESWIDETAKEHDE